MVSYGEELLNPVRFGTCLSPTWDAASDVELLLLDENVKTNSLLDHIYCCYVSLMRLIDRVVQT